jgi:hypothetical protein
MNERESASHCPTLAQIATQVISKILVYIVREASPEMEVLVFDRLDLQGEALPLPGGSVSNRRKSEDAVRRENNLSKTEHSFVKHADS